MGILAALLCATTAAWAASPAEEVRKVLDDQQQAWNRGDVSAFLAGYANSPDTLFVGNAVTRGWSAVAQRYRTHYDSPEKMGKLRFSQIEVKMLGADYAFVLGRFELERTAAGGGAAGGWFTLVFARTREGWKIIADHTS